MHETSIPTPTQPNPLRLSMLALLFSDIEGSTERWERASNAMREALARHDAILRAAISEAGGKVFKTVGDAFCATFPDVLGAISAALAAQRTLQADGFSDVGGLQIRMAVHAGAVECRDSDYFGQPLNRVARLLAAGHGGQVLVSRVAADLAWAELPPRASLRDLGQHRLKDVVQPETIFQLVAPDLRSDFPPLRSLAALANNLPQQVTPLIGREQELAEIETLLERHRLVTLVGSGGVGKTRVSLQVGADLVDRYPDGVWLVELAPLIDPLLVAETIAGIFGVSAATGNSPLDTVVGILKQMQTLLIIDNCEHLVGAVAQLADAIMRSCPGVSILASSRESLAIAGESTYRMPSLSFPDKVEGIVAKTALAHYAVRLFAERAAAAVPGFTVTDANAPAVAAICKRLDGVALAIELAAPRLKMLKPQDLAARLDDRFKILTGGSRTALPRQQTLKALLAWSYNLLSQTEQTLLRRLSVFAGGWTLDGAALVTVGEPVEEWEMFNLLASLVNKSLVAADTTGSEARYRLSESTREYAYEKLLESGERGRRRKLAGYLLTFYAKAEAVWPTSSTEAWLETYAPELDNLRAALEWAFGPEGDSALGIELASRSMRILLELGLFREIARWFDIAIERLDAATSREIVARLWFGKSQGIFFNEPTAVEPALRAVALYREVGTSQELGMALTRAACALWTPLGSAEVDLLLKEAHEILRPLGRSKHLATCLMAIGVTRPESATISADNAAVARESCAEAAAMCRAIGDSSGLRFVLAQVAEIEMASGDAKAAASLARELVAEAMKNNDRRALANIRQNLAGYLLALGSIEEARHAAHNCLRDSRSLGLSFVTGCVEHLALVSAMEGQVEQAARLIGYGTAWYAARETSRENTERITYDRVMALLAEKLQQDQRDCLIAEGATWSEDQATAVALTV